MPYVLTMSEAQPAAESVDHSRVRQPGIGHRKALLSFDLEMPQRGRTRTWSLDLDASTGLCRDGRPCPGSAWAASPPRDAAWRVRDCLISAGQHLPRSTVLQLQEIDPPDAACSELRASSTGSRALRRRSRGAGSDGAAASRGADSLYGTAARSSGRDYGERGQESGGNASSLPPRVPIERSPRCARARLFKANFDRAVRIECTSREQDTRRGH